MRWFLWSLDVEVKNCGLRSIHILRATFPREGAQEGLPKELVEASE